MAADRVLAPTLTQSWKVAVWPNGSRRRRATGNGKVAYLAAGVAPLIPGGAAAVLGSVPAALAIGTQRGGRA